MAIALERLRFGDGYLEPGDEVPWEPGRNYVSMLYLGQINELPVQPESAELDVSAEDLAAKLKRSELDKQAKEAGVESPGDLPNKDAVAEAITARKELDALNRKDLNRRAELAGVDAPEKLPNKAAVIDAVLAAQEAGVESSE